MHCRKRRRLLRPSYSSNWTNTTNTAICPSYLDGSTSLRKCFTKPYGNSNVIETFNAFTKYVETQRLPVHKNEIGSRSLQNISLDMVIQKLSQIYEFGDFPKHLARRLWDTLNKRCQLSFHSWKLLSEALHNEVDATLAMFHYRQTISRPDSPLHVYCDPLTSVSFKFIAALSITVQFPVASIVKLANLSNLGILEIIGTPTTEASSNPGMVSSIGDIALRAWSRETAEHGCFKVLRILRLLNQQDITEKSLQYLQAFPALGIFDVRGCGIHDGKRAESHVEKFGWKTLQQHGEAFELERGFLGKPRASRNQSMTSEGMVKSSFEPLWDGSRVHRISRSAMRENVSHPQTSSSQPITDLSGSISDNCGQKWHVYVNESAAEDVLWNTLSWNLFRATAHIKKWNFANAPSWAQLGSIRNDSDLIEAGVSDAEKLAIVGKYLVTPVPVAYICLGDSEILNSPYLAALDETQDSSSANLIFIRPDDTFERLKGPDRKIVGTKPARRMKKGKRKIGDILSEFAHG